MKLERLDGPRIKTMSTKGVSWLVELECGKKGPQLRAYRDVGGIPTIGVGQTTFFDGKKWRRVEMTDRFNTVLDALAAFRRGLTAYEVGVDAATRDDVPQSVFDALVSFCYNIGIPAFTRSTAVWWLNEYRPIGDVCEALERWNRVGGRIDQGLINRRECESWLLKHGEYKTQGEV